MSGKRSGKFRSSTNVGSQGQGKGSWAGGNAPAQGGTPQNISRPVEGTAQFGGCFADGHKSACKGGAQK